MGTSFKFKGNDDYIYPYPYMPVGSIYLSVNSTNPTTYFGGTWEQIAKGRTLVGVDTSDSDFSSSQKTGGEKTHKTTINEIPSHQHIEYYVTNDGNRNPAVINSSGSTAGTYAKLEDSYYQAKAPLLTGATGGSQAHNNLQPYFTCYIWLRTA